jgi:Ca2+-binding RTX toxin-like protein
MTHPAPLGTVGGLTVASPGAIENGLSIADRSVAAIAFFGATPQTVNPTNGALYHPGPLVDKGTSLLFGVPVTGLGIQVTRTALVAAGQDLFLPVNLVGAISTEESEVVPPEGSNALLAFAPVPTPLDLRVTINGEDLEATLGVDLVDFRETYGDDPDAVEPTVGVNLASDNGLLGGADLPLDPDVLSGVFGLDPTYVAASVVADGQALLLKDVPVGKHTIVLEGELDSDGDGVADLSYETTFRIEVVEPITGSAGNDLLTGTSGNDILDGNNGNDWLCGLAGADRLEGDKGRDKLEGGCGRDVLLGGKGNDSAYGGYGDDVIILGTGADRGFGNAGDDALLGEAGDDLLRGGQGDDTLAGGAGTDMLTGGSGSDTFQFAFGDGSDIVTDFDVGADVMRFFGAVFSGFGSQDELTIESVGEDTRISYGNPADLDEVLLRGVDAATLTADNFAFS